MKILYAEKYMTNIYGPEVRMERHTDKQTEEQHEWKNHQW